MCARVCDANGQSLVSSLVFNNGVEYAVHARQVSTSNLGPKRATEPAQTSEQPRIDKRMAPDQHAQHHQHDRIQDALDQVTRRLVRPAFLCNLTPSRLPSQAASSDSSLSPRSPGPTHEARSLFGPHASHRRPSHLNQVAVIWDDALEKADLVAPLILEPYADGSAPSVEPVVRKSLESHFVGARKMASDRFQTFSHGHQDLVLAVDFNYFGTRMVTASSDHRLKVWDKKDDSWSLVESWKAHDAEIVDVSRTTLLSNLQPSPAQIRHPGICMPDLPHQTASYRAS